MAIREDSVGGGGGRIMGYTRISRGLPVINGS